MELGTSFKTTNLIESMIARVDAKSRRLARRRTRNRKLRWCAALALQIEQQFRKVKDYKTVGWLQQALTRKLHLHNAAAA